MITDSFGRIHNYLRVSLTEACNLACTYCMPDNDFKMPVRHKMNADELIAIAKSFVMLGTEKIRITGGEPLVRKDAAKIILALAALKEHGLKNLAITTNGILAHQFIDVFKQAGIHSVNVSLDTLMPDRFEKIAKRDFLHQVISNIHLLMQNGFHVKVNMVVMQNVNDDEVIEFVRWTRDYPLHVRFIEFMPFDGNRWQKNKVATFEKLMQQIHHYFEVESLHNEKHDTAKSFKVTGFEGTFAFITTMSQPFCSDCNRMRLTADGKMKNCLFSQSEIDLLTEYRSGKNLEQFIRDCIMSKKAERGGQFDSLIPDDASGINNRSMISIGG